MLIIIVSVIARDGATTPLSARPLELEQSSWRQTVSLYQRNGCLTSEQIEYGKEVLKGLSYNDLRIFRVFCRLPALDFEQYQQVWSLLIRHQFSYEQVLSFELLSTLDDADFPLLLKALPAIHELNYEQGVSFRGFLQLPDMRAGYGLHLIPVLQGFSTLQQLGLQALISVNGMTAATVTDLFLELQQFTDQQAMVLEAFCHLDAVTPEDITLAFPLIAQLKKRDGWNAQAFFSTVPLTAAKAWSWLVQYFAVQHDVQERQFYTFTQSQKAELLRGLYAGGEQLSQEINNLHGITDRFGMELSAATLSSMSAKNLSTLLYRLPLPIRAQYGGTFNTQLRQNHRQEALATLRQATRSARRYICQSLTTANIYALLARGSELYDSSFRDYLVPELKSRLEQRFNNNLLTLLNALDPSNLLIADFIAGCAQKGKLAVFFPTTEIQQRELLDLVAGSAFNDEESILGFSASLLPLFQVLTPGARSYFIQQIISAAYAADKTASFSVNYLSAILQYYLAHHKELLSAQDSNTIRTLVNDFGPISFAAYQQTPFAQWKEDHQLTALSLFHPDDDGLSSFFSFCFYLLKKGYTLKPYFHYLPPAENVQDQMAKQLGVNTKESVDLEQLFWFLHKNRTQVAFTRTINNITITHVLSVYSTKLTQQKLLKAFLESKHEMLIQRGHSYWRDQQIITPLVQLKEQNQMDPQLLGSKQRFVSLGSCGGVKTYSQLNNLFSGTIDIFATIGTGLTHINTPYNAFLLEFVAQTENASSWEVVAEKSAFLFASERGQDYIHPGSLTACLHKMRFMPPHNN